MSEFKVGDRVRIIENDVEGLVEQVMVLELRDYSNLNEGDFDCRYRVVNKNKFYDNLTNNDLELIEASKQLTLEQLEQRIEKLEKCVMGEQNSLEKCENVSSMSKNGLLTEDERVILRNLDKKWKWIARDKDESLGIFNKEPFKDYDLWRNGRESYDFSSFKHLFQFIKWTDKEPYNIEELLKGECGNE